ncbi:hypothetical protein [Ottowia sp.]|uniref:hypothetical protein n=1 Tax=Ottowia sp. TaxID=1898956 RepID=UPI0025FDD482|nr:hypothetical protein [Ottowia sp.]MBK6616310.1 hypothetical protein [Ottowia sp.]
MHAYWDTRTLAEIGVQPGWFCRHGTCSIWLEVLRVFEDMLVCVSRSPAKGTDLVMHSRTYAGLDWLSASMPVGSVILAEPRAKNFFDKFYPEREAMAAFVTAQEARMGVRHG